MIRAPILLVLVFASTAHAQSLDTPIYRAGQAAVLASNVADVATTLHGWSLGHHEANPLIGSSNNVGRLLIVKSAGVGVQLLLMRVLAKTGHPKAAGFLGLGWSTVPTWAAIHNARLGG
jgi:hypothetical protein